MNELLADKLQEVKAAKSDRRQGAIERYYGCVFASGRGEEVDPQTVAEALEDYGKTIEQFESDCLLFVKRSELAAELDCDKNSSQTINDASAEIGRLVAERNRAVERFQQKINAEVARRDEAVNLSRRAAGIKHELKECAWPFLVEGEKELVQECSNLGAMRQELGLAMKTELSNIAKHKSFRDHDNSKLHKRGRGFVNDASKKYAAQCVIEAEARLKQLQAREAELAAESEELLAEIEKINERKLVP